MKRLSFRISFLIILIMCVKAGITQNPGDNLFNHDQVIEIRVTFSQPGFWDSLVQNYSSTTYMKADIKIGATQLNNVGIRIKGNSSYNSYPGVKKSFKIDFNRYDDGQEFDGLKKINLNNGFKDPTMIREKIFLDFLQDQDLFGPRAAFGRVYLNDTYWGLYTIVEQVDPTFLRTNFDEDEGNLFKGDPRGSLKWRGDDQAIYEMDYELHTNEAENDWDDLINLIEKINNTSKDEFHESLNEIFYIDHFLGSWAANILFVNLDSYAGSGHNYYLYNYTPSEKFIWIAWDANEAFGNFNQGMDISAMENLSVLYTPTPKDRNILNTKVLENNELTDRYLDFVYHYILNGFNESNLNPKIDELADLIRDDIYADNNKMFTNQHFEDNLEQDLFLPGMPGGGWIPGLKSFIANRKSAVLNELSGLGYVPTGIDKTVDDEPSIMVFPNPVSKYLYIVSNAKSINSDNIILYNLLGEKIDILVAHSQGNIHIDVSIVPNGVYILKANDRFVKQVVVIH